MDPADQTFKGSHYSIVATLIESGPEEGVVAQTVTALKEHPGVKCLVGLNAAAKGSPIWATFSMRVTAVPLGLAFVLAMRLPVRGSLRHWPLLAGVGLADTGANILFGLAGNRGLLSVVAVLASLYPVIVVALARVLLSERLAPSQLGGAAAALAGVALISAG